MGGNGHYSPICSEVFLKLQSLVSLTLIWHYHIQLQIQLVVMGWRSCFIFWYEINWGVVIQNFTRCWPTSHDCCTKLLVSYLVYFVKWIRTLQSHLCFSLIDFIAKPTTSFKWVGLLSDFGTFCSFDGKRMEVREPSVIWIIWLTCFMNGNS